jgi:hypothetical protein
VFVIIILLITIIIAYDNILNSMMMTTTIMENLCRIRGRDNSVGIGTRLRPGRPGFDSLQGREFVSSSPRSDRLCRLTRLPYNRYRGSFPGYNLTGTYSWPPYLHLASRLKNAWSYTSNPPYVFMARYSDKPKANFTFLCIRRILGAWKQEFNLCTSEWASCTTVANSNNTVIIMAMAGSENCV